MECREIKEALSAYIDGELGTAEKRTLEEHIGSCEDCRTLLSELNKSVLYLKNLEEMDPPPWFTQKVMSKVQRKSEKKERILHRLFPQFLMSRPIHTLATILILVMSVYLFQTIKKEASILRAPTKSAEVSTVMKNNERMPPGQDLTRDRAEQRGPAPRAIDEANVAIGPDEEKTRPSPDGTTGKFQKREDSYRESIQSEERLGVSSFKAGAGEGGREIKPFEEDAITPHADMNKRTERDAFDQRRAQEKVTKMEKRKSVTTYAESSNEDLEEQKVEMEKPSVTEGTTDALPATAMSPPTRDKSMAGSTREPAKKMVKPTEISEDVPPVVGDSEDLGASGDVTEMEVGAAKEAPGFADLTGAGAVKLTISVENVDNAGPEIEGAIVKLGGKGMKKEQIDEGRTVYRLSLHGKDLPDLREKLEQIGKIEEKEDYAYGRTGEEVDIIIVVVARVPR